MHLSKDPPEREQGCRRRPSPNRCRRRRRRNLAPAITRVVVCCRRVQVGPRNGGGQDPRPRHHRQLVLRGQVGGAAERQVSLMIIFATRFVNALDHAKLQSLRSNVSPLQAHAVRLRREIFSNVKGRL